MASAFNLTAQLNLRGPSNIRPIIGQMRKELGSLNADIKFSIDKGAVKSVDAIRAKVDGLNASLVAAKSNAKDLTVIFRDLQSSLSSTKGLNIGGGGKSLATTAASAQAATKNLQQTTSAIEEFGQKSALAFKRFAAYTIATTGIFALVNAVNQGVKAFIEFERRLIQLRQVTGSGAVGIASLEKEITSLATTLGVSSDSLAQVAITLAQAGLSANETRIALAALAKTDLAPSFDNLTDTTEGAIAALRQFGLEAGDLESVLGSINAVAAKFAVESGDIIAAIQRTGGVFASASKGVTEGKDALNEFIAVFTSVRATTRESAETIATGLRTIFTRIQRAKTIDQLKEFGVNLQDLEGKFVGPFEAVRRLSEALNQLDPRDIRFATIVEELGGFRQIGKVIPLIQQFATAQEALKVAQQGAGSLTEAQVLAQQSLANQIAKVREQFLALIRDVGKSTTFQVITKTVLTLTSGLISLAGAFKPILPILGILGTIKGISAISQFATGFFGLAGKGGGGPDTGDTVAQSERERAEATNRASDVIRENTTAITGLTSAIQSLEASIKSRGPQTLNGGGKVLAFARGGVVPGSGNRDTVPAMLQPGEFVIRKKAVESLGASNLQKMNKYATGGKVNITASELKNRSSSSSSIKNIISDDMEDDLYRRGSAVNTQDNISFFRRIYKLNAPDLINDSAGFEKAVADKTSGILTSEGKNDPTFPIDITNSNYGPLEVRNRQRGTSNRTILDKLMRYYLSSNQTRRLSNQPGPDDISLGNIGVVYNSAKYDPPNAKELNLGGLVQKFANGGKAEPYYGQAEVEAAKAAQAEYQKSIQEAFSLESIYFDVLEGKNIAQGITPEVYGTGIGKLQKGEPGVVGTKRVSFTQADTADPKKTIPDTKALKAAALAARQAQLQAYTDAEDAISAFKQSGVLTNVSPDILSYIQTTIDNLDNSILDADVTESIRKKLTKPNLAAFAGLMQEKQQRVEVQGQRTKLAEVFNSILETYGSDVSVKEIDAITGALGKKLSGGGIASKFAIGGEAKLIDTTSIIRSVEELGGPQQIRGLLGVEKINAAIKQVQSQGAPPTAKQLFSKNFLDSERSGPYLSTVSDLLGDARLAVKQPRVFSEEEKANATKLAVVGMTPFDLNETKFEELAGRIVSLNLATLKSDKAPAVEQMRSEIDKVLGNFATNLGGQNLANIDDQTKEAIGLGNLEGYMIEAVLAKLGANPGRLDDRSVDYANGLGPAASLFGIDPNVPTEVKRDVKSGLSKARENFANYFKKFADGGEAKQDKNFGKVALRTGSRIQATYIKEGEAAAARSGQVIADSIGNGLYAVQSSSATKGYGPKLYDIVMEAATAAGGMLTSDRRTVSDAAKNVWSYYFKNRSDVKKTPLDPENWVSNSRLLDEKLYGPPETWPAPTDPAWILQSGYSKAPSDINNPNLVQRLAKGGSVEDTVPALLTPGEFVINKKAAQKIGYGQLKKLNHADKMQGYNKGGIVGGVQAFKNGGVATPNERAAANITKVIQTLEASGTATPEAIDRLEEVVAKLLNETINSKEGILETAQVIKELRANSDKSTSDQINTLNNIVTAIKSTGDFQSAAAEKQTQAIESFLARTKGQPGTAIVGQFPPAQPPSGPDVLEQVEADRQKTLENIAQAAFAAGKGLEEFITDLESFYTTVKDNQIAKMQEEVGGPLTLSQTRQAAVSATAATEQYGGVKLGDFLVNDFENLSSVIKEEIAVRKESAKAAAQAAAEAKKAADEYKSSGKAYDEFGILGAAVPGSALKFKQTQGGGKLLGAAQAFQGGGLGFDKLKNVLAQLPGPVGNAVRAIGGLPGVLATAASAIGSDLLPQIGKLIGLSSDPTFAGVSGALAEGGSMAASLGTIGQQLAGPIGAMIGTIGGAISGAISGFIKGFRTKTLENSLTALGKSSEEARKSLELLAKTNTGENAERASRAIGKLQTNVQDLGIQAQRTGAERAGDAASGAASGATYGGIIATVAAIAAIPTGGISLAVAAGIVAVGAAIGAVSSALSGPDELDDEALKSQIEAIGQYIEGINQLGQRRLNMTGAEEVGRFLDDLQNASTQAEKFAVGARTTRVQEAQRAAITRELGPNAIRDNQSVQDVTSTNANAQAVAKLAEERYYEQLAMEELNRVYKGNVDAIRRESKDRDKLIRRGKELNVELGEQEAKQRLLAIASTKVQRALEGFIDVFKLINAGIKRFADESDQYIKEVDSSVSGLLGNGALRDVNRENERILANPAAYSIDEVRRAGAGVAGLAGGGADAQQIGNMALASKLIEDRLPALLRGLEPGSEAGAGSVIGEIKDLFETAGIDINNDTFGAVFKEISKSIEQAVAGGDGTSTTETLLKDLIPQVSQILEKGREVALNIQKEYNDTIQRTIDLQNKANNLLLKANEYERKAQQIRLNAGIQLAERVGTEFTAEQLNAPLNAEVTSLTSGLIEGGSTDPKVIADAIIASNKRIDERQRALDSRRSAVGLIGAADGGQQASADMIRANDAEQKAISEEIKKTNEASKALETLANSGELAANAMKLFDQAQKKTAGFTNFLDKLIVGSPEENDRTLREQATLNRFLTGQVSQQELRGSTETRQLIAGGMSSLQDVLPPEAFRSMQAQFRRQVLESQGVDLNQKTNIMIDGVNQTIDQLLSRAENPEETPEAKAFKAAAEAQARAAEEMAKVNREAAAMYMDASNKIRDFFISEFPDIVRNAFAQVQAVEESAREASKPGVSTPTTSSATEKALEGASKRREEAGARYQSLRTQRQEQEASWVSSPAGVQMARGLEQNAREEYVSAKDEETRLKEQIKREKEAAAQQVAQAKAEAKAAKEAELKASRESASTTAPPSARLTGVPQTPSTDPSATQVAASATSEAAQQQNASATNLNTASTALTDSAQNLNNVTAGMRASGGTAGTTADIPGARATVAAATTVQNREEIEQQLFLRLDEGTQRFLGEFNTSLATTFTTFGTEFGNYITRLEQIKLPEKIEMTGRHTVDVRVTGAAGFDKLQDSMKNMIASAIKDKMSMIWNQSGGQYGERPD